MSLMYASSKSFQSGAGDGDWDDRVPDDGYYVLELTDVRPLEEKDNIFKPGTRKTEVPLEWTIVSDVTGDDEYAGVNFLQWYTYSLNELATLTKFVLALRNNEPFIEEEDRLPGEPQEDFDKRREVDLKDYLGKRIVAGLSSKKKAKSDWQEGQPMSLRTHKVVLDSPKPVKQKKAKPVNDEPLPPALQRRRTAPADDDFDIPEGFDTDAA